MPQIFRQTHIIKQSWCDPIDSRRLDIHRSSVEGWWMIVCNLMQLEFGMCFDVYIPKLRIILI